MKDYLCKHFPIVAWLGWGLSSDILVRFLVTHHSYSILRHLSIIWLGPIPIIIYLLFKICSVLGSLAV